MNIKYYRKVTCLLLLLLGAMACTDRIIDDGDGGSGEEVPVILNLKGLFGEENAPPTYAPLIDPDGPDRPGTDYENQVTDVKVFIFNAVTNVCEKIMTTAYPNYTPVGPTLVKSGNKNIIVVVNATGKFTSFYAPGDEAQVNYNILRYKITDPSLTSLPEAPFLMTAEKNVMLQPHQDLNAPNVIDIEVKRAVAKVKIFVKKSGDAASHNLWLKKVTLNQGADAVSVLYNHPSNPPGTINYSLISERITFDPANPATRVIPAATGTDPGLQVADTFYTYETLASRDKSKAVYFDFEVEVNSSANVRKCRVYLAEDPLTATDTVYNVKRNNWYNIYVDIVKPGLDSVYVKVIASPWNVADTIPIVVGAGYEAKTASPFKFVKYYDADDWKKDSTIAVINSHSKGASWIDLRVTETTPWSLSVSSAAAGSAGTLLSADTGKTWQPLSLSGIGTNIEQRIYIYRPYVENNEPKSGLPVTLNVGGQNVRTFTVQPRDSLIFPTNSYILRPRNFSGSGRSEAFIPLSHVYDFWEDFLLANGDTIPGGYTPTVALSWQDTSDLTVLNQAIINPLDRKNSYIRLESGPVQGNAILDFKVNNVIYWSFHIWNTEYNPYEPAGQLLYKTSYNKNIFMDRNLGAMDTLYTESGSAQGLNYQFGRKDPFPISERWWGPAYIWYKFPGPSKQTTIITGTAPSAGTNVRPLPAIQTVLKNPTTFYTGNVSAFTSESGGHSWSTKYGNKTAFDPCPEGYRVPVQTAFGDTYSPWYGTTPAPSGGGMYEYGTYILQLNYFPFMIIKDNGTGTDLGFYWTSHDKDATSNEAIAMSIDWGAIHNLNYGLSKSMGAKIRCVVDKNYILNKKGTVFGRYTTDIINNL